MGWSGCVCPVDSSVWFARGVSRANPGETPNVVRDCVGPFSQGAKVLVAGNGADLRRIDRFFCNAPRSLSLILESTWGWGLARVPTPQLGAVVTHFVEAHTQLGRTHVRVSEFGACIPCGTSTSHTGNSNNTQEGESRRRFLSVRSTRRSARQQLSRRLLSLC